MRSILGRIDASPPLPRRQSLLPRLEKFLRPEIIEVLDSPLAPAKLGDTLFTAQTPQHDADPVFRREVSPRRTADALDNLFRGFLRRRGFLLTFAP